MTVETKMPLTVNTGAELVMPYFCEPSRQEQAPPPVSTLPRLVFLTLLLFAMTSLAATQMEPSRRVKSVVLFEGQNAVFVCEPRGLPRDTFTFQWSLNDTHIVATERSFAINNVRKNNSGMYRCTVQAKTMNKAVVAQHVLFVHIKSTATMLAQMVDEGVSVTIHCNITDAEVPSRAKDLRYQWHDPNGTLVGNRWFLRLANIRIHESGVYVCTASVDVDGTVHEASHGTRIDVIKPGTVVFPGLLGHSIDVPETGSVSQSCQVRKEHDVSKYSFHWLGPDSRRVSDGSQLKIVHALRSRHSGAYTCVATAEEAALRDLEGTLHVVVVPLRFQISIVAEDRRLGGFTHRRVDIAPPPSPLKATQEQFNYTWLNPEGCPVTSQPSPEMHVRFKSLQDFGLYKVRVQGVHSGYKNELQSNVLLQDSPRDGYELLISRQAETTASATRVAALCEVRPAHPGATVRWVNAQNLPVTSDGRLVVERPDAAGMGEYVCEAFLPHGIILRQLLTLPHGNGTGPSEGGSGPDEAASYAVQVVHHPPHFVYGDAVQLRCIVRPERPNMAFQWTKDGRTVGDTQILSIASFGRSDAGKYRCRATVQPTVGYAEEVLALPSHEGRNISGRVTVKPEKIIKRAWESFTLTCVASEPSRPLVAIKGTGAKVDGRFGFTVARPSANVLVVTATRGLGEMHGNMTFECSVRGGERRDVEVVVLPRCPSGLYSCSDGSCHPLHRLCNRVPDCRDGADEDPEVCTARESSGPWRSIVTSPWRPFEFVCSAPSGSRPAATILNAPGVNVEADRRFTVTRPLPHEIIVQATHGLTEVDNGLTFICLAKPDTREYIRVTVEPRCSPHQRLCRDGTCLLAALFCDGRSDCSDGSDESHIFCSRSGDGREALIIVPGEIRSRPRIPFTFACRAPTGLRPDLIFSGSGQPVRESKHFRVSRPRRNEIVARAPQGMPGKNALKILCVLKSGEQKSIDISIEETCVGGGHQCPDGSCVPQPSLCIGSRGCKDGPEETFYKTIEQSATLLPRSIRVPPRQPFTFVCTGPRDVRPEVYIANAHMLVSCDQRFTVERPTVNNATVTAINGLLETHDGIAFTCMTPAGEQRLLVVSVERPCGRDMFQCHLPSCISSRKVCDGRRDCPDGSDEDLRFCPEMKMGVSMAPRRIRSPPWREFRFVCIGPSSSRVELVFAHNHKPVVHDPRFEAVRISENVVHVTAPRGLRGTDDVTIECSLKSGMKDHVRISIDDACPFGQSQCKEGRCIDWTEFCNGQKDCTDASDEDPGFCAAEAPAAGLTILPESIVTPPWKNFSFVCAAPPGSRADVVFREDGRPVERDPRFAVRRRDAHTIEVTAPLGLREVDNTTLECSADLGHKRTITLAVRGACPTGKTSCRGGSCIPVSHLCDRRTHCSDGSDEFGQFCGAGGSHPFVVAIRPAEVKVAAWTQFSFSCTGPPGVVWIPVIKSDGSRVDADSRFRVTTRNDTTIEIAAPKGLSGADDMQIECLTSTGESKAIKITVGEECEPDEFSCEDGSCIPRANACDGTRHCSDGSDEGPRSCRDRSDVGSLVAISPPTVEVYEWTPFRFVCNSRAGRLTAHFRASGGLVEYDHRFHVARVNSTAIEISAPFGLRNVDDMEIECVSASGDRNSIAVVVHSHCPRGHSRCRDGECIRTSLLCDFVTHCADHTDELLDFCVGRRKPLMMVDSPRIRVSAWQTFEFVCSTPDEGDVEAYFSSGGGRVEEDPRFRVLRHNSTAVTISAPEGLRDIDDTRIECVASGGDRKRVSITVDNVCGGGNTQCGDGSCILQSQLCDGIAHCSDRSDENPRFCGGQVGPGIFVDPPHINKSAWAAFEFMCRNSRGTPMNAVFASDGSPVALDPRFRVTALNASTIIVEAPRGLRDVDDLTILCVSSEGEKADVAITVWGSCGEGGTQCRDGGCIEQSELCDGIAHCLDRSDEETEGCKGSKPVLSPPRVVVRPWRPFRTVCLSSRGSQPAFIFQKDGSPVEKDRRYRVRRINATATELVAPTGLRGQEDVNSIQCIDTVSGAAALFRVVVESSCRTGHMPCRDGSCLPFSHFCDGQHNCHDKSDEAAEFCAVRRPAVTVIPNSIITEPWKLIRFYCTAPSGHPIRATFSTTHQPVNADRRYRLRQVNSTTLEIVAPRGLRGPEDNSRIDCLTAGGESGHVTVAVRDSCGPGRLPCRGGACLPVSLFCDGKRDCPDGSDEYAEFCPRATPTPSPWPAAVRLSPGKQRVRPGQAIRLECSAPVRDAPQRPVVELANVAATAATAAAQSLFRVEYPQPGRAVITIPRGTEVPWNHLVFRCHLPGGDKARADVFVERACAAGQRRCDDGTCLYTGQFCDGERDCADGSDEMSHNCDACDPISLSCGEVRGRKPRVPYFQAHWRCDGEDDCGNGFDELNCVNYSRVPGQGCGSPRWDCPRSGIQVPLAYRCDGQVDCPNGEDELNCMRPSVYSEGWVARHEARRGQSLVIECEVVGVPPPTIVWRFNWGCLPRGGRARVEPVSSRFGCNGSRSRLTIRDVQEGDDGVYNCEGLSGLDRALSQDILVVLVD